MKVDRVWIDCGVSFHTILLRFKQSKLDELIKVRYTTHTYNFVIVLQVWQPNVPINQKSENVLKAMVFVSG